MRPALIDLLCLPPAGASATMYLRWRRLLPEWIRVVPVELPGRGARMGEPLAEDFDWLIHQLCAEQGRRPAGHYALFGHSMGALLAHGMAQRLRALAQPLPRALFVSACAAPARRDADRFAGKGSDDALVADLRKQGGTPEEVFGSPELMRITLDTLRADYRVCESFSYRPEPPLPVPIHAFGGRSDDIAIDRMGAWRREAAGAFTLEWFAGGHFFIRGQEAQVLQAIVRELLHQFAGVVHGAAETA